MRIVDLMLALIGVRRADEEAPRPAARRLTPDEIRNEIYLDQTRRRGWVNGWRGDERPSPIVRIPWR